MTKTTHYRTPGQQEYRDSLAKKLKTARTLGAEGEELAKVLLEKEQGNPEYQEAKEGRDGIRRTAIENRDKGIVAISDGDPLEQDRYEECPWVLEEIRNTPQKKFLLAINTEGNLVLYSDGKNIHRGTFMTRLVKHGYIEPDVRWNPETRQQETMKTSWSKVSDFLMGGGQLQIFDEQHGLRGRQQKTIELQVGGVDLGAIDEKFYPAMQKMLEKQYPDYMIIIHPPKLETLGPAYREH